MLFKELHEAFGHILYFDEPHIYVDTNTGEYLKSVTTLIKDYRHPFKRDYHINRLINSPTKEKYFGRTYQDVKDEWDKLRVLGTSSGSILHDYLEHLWSNKIYPLNYYRDDIIKNLSEEEFKQFEDKCITLTDYADKFKEEHPNIIPIKPELIVGNDKYAGQIDLLAYDTAINEYILIDYKNDKKIGYTNQYQNFKKPLTHLEDCEFNKYSLQVNLYRKLLEPVIEINHMYIIWFNIKNDSYVKLRVKKDDNNINLIL